MMFF
jgi:hypothetical protein